MEKEPQVVVLERPLTVHILWIFLITNFTYSDVAILKNSVTKRLQTPPYPYPSQQPVLKQMFCKEIFLPFKVFWVHRRLSTPQRAKSFTTKVA